MSRELLVVTFSIALFVGMVLAVRIRRHLGERQLTKAGEGGSVGFVTLVAALLAGFGMAGSRIRSWLHAVGFSLVMAISAYVILDLEFPRRGRIRMDRFDHALVDLPATMD